MKTMYLVELSHSMDDFPVRLFEDKTKALQFAQKMEWMPSTGLLDGLGRGGAASPVCVTLVTLRRGVPVKSELVKLFEDEE